MTGLDALLGTDQPTQCKVFAPDLAVHWFPTAEGNVPCFCGATMSTIAVETEDDDDLEWE